MDKNFDEWNEVKKRTDKKIIIPKIRQREIYWANIGENVGYEQNGKGTDFMRPLLIFKKFSNNLFLGYRYLLKRKKREPSFLSLVF